ncbi:serine protease inhibitor 42Dd [Drosophila innubila]|uniref:serine protease inhibitor 42Dd n=1 Tax=Drosophila innubila TaxID=198719 RepID=UPI00148BE36E|nr:serine protease inhibitor 42Dd [Drosophila innubila]
MQLYLGAGGETAKQIENMLQLNNSTRIREIRQLGRRMQRLQRSRYLTLKSGSRIYVAKDLPLLTAYQKESRDFFNTTVEKVDFKSSDETISQMNAWIAKKTDNKIKFAITEIAHDTKMMLLSAIYFEGKWKYPFNSLDTRKASFFIPQKTGDFRTVLVDTMKRKGYYKYSYISKLNAYSIEIPYTNSDISLIILLPKNMDGVDEVVQNLDAIHFHEIAPRDAKTNFRILLPKFKIGSMLKMKSALESLGIHDLFKDANLGAMTEMKTGLFVNEIFQKTEIEVNEKGSRPVTIKKLDFGYISRQFVAEVNHPFVFLVKDRTTIYLAGRVNRLE